MDWLQHLWLQSSPPFVPTGMPYFERNLVATLVIALALGLALGPLLGFHRRAAAIVWLVCLLVPLAYTLSLASSYGGGGTCDLSWRQVFSSWSIVQPDPRANLLLLMPAGAAAMLLPEGPRRLAALGTALAMPVAIELTQMLLPRLGRGCQVADALNNQMGALVGFWLAAGIWVLWNSLRLELPSHGHAVTEGSPLPDTR